MMSAAESSQPWTYARTAEGSTDTASPDATLSESAFDSTSPGSSYLYGFAGAGAGTFASTALAPRPGPSKGTKGKPKHIPGGRVKRYHERSMHGCLTCRKRRVKCDETKPVCQRCACGDRECVYVSVDTAASSSKTSASQDLSPTRAFNAESSERRHQPSSASYPMSALLHPGAGNGVKRESHDSGAAPLFQTGYQRLPPLSNGFRIDEGYHHVGTSDGWSTAGAPAQGEDGFHTELDAAGRRAASERHAYEPDSSGAGPVRKLARLSGFSARPSVVDSTSTNHRSMPSQPREFEPLAAFSFDSLAPFLPTVEEQSLFRHFVFEVAPRLCTQDLSLVENPWVRHIAQLAVREPAGATGFSESLRSAILSISGLDLSRRASPVPAGRPHSMRMSPRSDIRSPSFEGQQTRNGGGGAAQTASGMAAIPASSTPSAPADNLASAFLLELSSRRREASFKALSSAISGRNDRNDRLTRADAVQMLAAVLCLSVRDRLAGHTDWRGALRNATSTIVELGGPAALVDAADGASQFMVEQLAAYETLDTLIVEPPPLFLQPWDTWWHRLMGSSEEARSDDSVSQTLGIRRGLIDLLARITRVEVTRKELQSRTGRSVTLSDTGAIPSAPLPAEYEETRVWLDSTVRGLRAEISTWWTRSTSAKGITSPHTNLLDLVNDLYVATADLYMQSILFRRPSDHLTLTRPMASVLDRCEEAVRAGHTQGLILPLCFAAASAPRLGRERIRAILFDLHRACHLDMDRIHERLELLWRLVDARSVPLDLGLLADVACYSWSL
ncbi:uncharacterized protein PFL1_00072 [Pseudozyma flocculosa PF-1]|uniref:Zn(2)-C6 fungal-type domain-containing protein n=1 Tax=Pseudozyma flocculosa TaxID=84751 RepID=A0A5C3ESD1_9BASI|nr:uncharacterized protein PFL1_00072 [Pseudozyma flocculosa PF-1]EPQ31873.1 hypothetical protein PFL1_00072 [Pseudozyma flocculosa PF-1]SPO35223.1 uncharacterized protein PSFLO_00694 [Pseudozyma flocculosa]